MSLASGSVEFEKVDSESTLVVVESDEMSESLEYGFDAFSSHSLCVTSPSKLMMDVLNVVLGFAAIAVAMMLPMFCGMTHMEFCPDRFQSLCASSVWLGIFPRSIWFSLVPGAPASLLTMVFCSLLLGADILTFKSIIDLRCQGMGKEKWCTQGSKTILLFKRRWFISPRHHSFSIQVECDLHFLLAGKLGAAARAATALCLFHWFFVNLERWLEYLVVPLVAAFSMWQASAAAFRTAFASVGWFVLSAYVAAKLLGPSAAASEYVTPMVKALLGSSSSRAAAFNCVSRVYTDYLGVWLSTTLSPR